MKTVLSACLLAGCFGTTWAAPADGSTQNLESVRQSISETRKEIGRTAAEQKKIDTSIGRSRTDLSRAQQSLAQIARQYGTAAGDIARLQAELDTLQTRIDGTRAQVSRLLNARYRNQSPNAVILLLNGTSAEDKGRYLEYLRYLNRANESTMARLRHQHQQLDEQKNLLRQRQNELAGLRKKQAVVIGSLQTQHQQQLAESSKLDSQLTQQQQKLSKLKTDEQRLSGLIRRLAAQAETRRRQEQAAALKKAREAAAQARNHAGSPSAATASAPPSSNTGLTAEELAAQAPLQPRVIPAFSRLQGQLKLPVRGTPSGRFGEPRENGGTRKGVFIATAPASVQAIAAGRVVYAASLEGYGNTVIVDHGGSYLSIYTGLGSIAVSAGSDISARRTLGTSGTVPDEGTGLYFEVRYRNQPVNPLSWTASA